jgi:hypothetical protein
MHMLREPSNSEDAHLTMPAATRQAGSSAGFQTGFPGDRPSSLGRLTGCPRGVPPPAGITVE